MKRKESSLMSILLIILCLNSIIYYEIQDADLSNNNPVDELFPQVNPNIDDDTYQIDDSFLIKKDLIPGDFKTFAFFSGGGTEAGNDLIDEPEYPNEADNNDTAYYPNVIEWVTYNEIKDGGHIPKELYWRSLSTDPITWPSSAGEWHHLRERNFPSEPSKMFSPVFTEDWEISGRVYYLTYIRTNDGAYFSEYITITMKFSVHLFNPGDNSSVELTSTTTPISVNTTLMQRTFSSNITGTYTIPAGYRLKYDIEYMYDTIPSSYSLLMYTGYPAGGLSGSLTWTITDPTYGNTYTLNNNQRMVGVQLYMRSKEFPAIDVYGVANETVYSAAENVTIDVTDGSISSYRWDGGTWNSFVNDTLTQIPAIHDWHYLEIKASDPVFNNTNVVLYKYGYDASAENLILNNAMSSDRLEGGFILDFSVFSVSTVTYEWDANGTEFPLLSPYDIVTDMFNGWHNLTVVTSDFYENITYFYIFEFDSDNPIILLYNVINESIYVPDKNIELKITDNSTFSYLKYSWDSGANQSWTEDPSNVYITNLPVTIGQKTLEVYVEDVFNHSSYSYFEFWVDDTIFKVDLISHNDGGYYQGGETVELIVQRSNTTCYYKWDSDSETNTTLVSTSLVLSGGDAMPTDEGNHTLTIRTFRLNDSVQQIFVFTFIVDTTAPVISNIQSYNDTRYLSSTYFLIYVEDNFITDNTTLVIEYSIDGKIYKNLPYDFVYSLLPYADGVHTLDLRVRDLAGNIRYVSIIFTIDTTDPDLDIEIADLHDFTGIDGNMYVPADALVQVTITDDDETTYSYYKINSGPKIPFTDSFILSFSYGPLVLRIYANDTLGNERSISYNLVLDSLAPNVIQTFPTTIFNISDFSDLEFDIEDFTLKNIESVIYHWDDAVGLGDFDVNDVDPYLDGHFRLELGTSARVLYSFYEYTLANLTIFAVDFLGNNKTYVFNYEIDITPPNASLEYFNLTWIPMVENNDPAYEIAGGSKIRYDNSTADDQLLIRYQWEINTELKGWEELDLMLNPEFELGKVDGNHTLIFEIQDNTGQGRTPNIKIATFNFYVDDMLIDFLYPIEFTDDFHYKMDYNDTFTYQVNITDAVDNEPIPGLVYEIFSDNVLNLSIIVNNINITIYEITIHGTNVTNYSETEIDVYFYRSGGGGQTVRVFIRVDKKIGVLNVLDLADTQIMYEEDLVVLMYMENDIGQNQTIKDVFVNGTEIESFSFDNTTFICSFNYSSFNIESKGNFSLSIYTDSTFYNASTNTNTTINFEIFPLPILITISVSNYTILEGTDVIINVLITYENGTPVEYALFNLYIHVYLKNITETDTFTLNLAYEDANYTESFTDLETGRNGRFITSFTLNSSMDYIIIEGSYEGQDTTDDASFVVEDHIITIPLPEAVKFPQWLLYLIIGGSIGVAALISLIIYKVTRPKSFEELMERVTSEDIALNYSIMSPGVILTIFDQRKGPIPLVADHSLDIGRYIGRMRIGVENFLLKIADQAYSSLGFEEHDAGRRVGSIILPSEKMVAFVHGVQLENKMTRGGFENLSLIVLADSEFGNLLLNYQEYLYGLVDDLGSALKSKKNLKVVEDFIVDIRKQSVIIMLAAQEMEKSQGGD